jgi:hypothetical protein
MYSQPAKWFILPLYRRRRKRKTERAKSNSTALFTIITVPFNFLPIISHFFFHFLKTGKLFFPNIENIFSPL